MPKPVVLAQSKFAVLSIDDDWKPVRKTKPKEKEAPAQTKKRNKPKVQDEGSDLRKMAFGTSKPPKQPRDSTSGQGKKSKSGDKNEKQDWDTWKQKDELLASGAYRRDLQEALLQSKIDFQKEKEQKSIIVNSDVNGVATEGKRGKKKKEKTISLDEFNQVEETSPVPRVPSLIAGEGDAKFFVDVENDVHTILKKEKMKEEFKKKYSQEDAKDAMTFKYEETIAARDDEIKALKEEMSTIKAEMKQVKKRNKQLCVILSEGEMKNKAQVLMQVENLTEVRDELTEQVSELTGELEKEKSKVHTMKSELDKLKGSKHHSGK